MKFFGLIVGLLLMVWYVPAMVWGVQITSAMNAFQKGDMSAMAGLTDGPAPLAWWRNRSELKETFDSHELNMRRYVGVEFRVPFEEILAPGEAMPTEDLRDLYAMARATGRIFPLCAELLDALATRCDSVGARGRVLNDGTATLEGNLLYVPAYDMGDPSKISSGDVFSGHARLTDIGAVDATAEGRAEVISRALMVCDALREVYGNCVISRLSFGPADRNGQFKSTGSFSVFADKSQHSRDTVRSTVEIVAAKALGATQ